MKQDVNNDAKLDPKHDRNEEKKKGHIIGCKKFGPKCHTKLDAKKDIKVRILQTYTIASHLMLGVRPQFEIKKYTLKYGAKFAANRKFCCSGNMIFCKVDVWVI